MKYTTEEVLLDDGLKLPKIHIDGPYGAPAQVA